MPTLLPSPRELSARLAERVEGAHHGEVADGSRSDRPATQPSEEVVERAIGATSAALVDDRLATFLAQVADVVEADAHREGFIIAFGQAPNVRTVDVDGQRL